MRTFSGADQFKELSRAVVDSYKKVFPIEKNGWRLEYERIWVDDSETDIHDYQSQKKAKLAGGTWGAPVYAALTLKSPEGKTVDRMDKIRLSTIPRLTPRAGYIVAGNEYQIPNQMIRKPGAYVVPSQKGDIVKGTIVYAHSDRADQFELNYDPAKSKFKVTIGQANIPLYPLLISLGATDQEILKAWGSDNYQLNAYGADNDYIKLAKKIAYKDVTNKADAIAAIQDFVKKTKMDGGVNKITLGAEVSSLGKEVLLKASKKIVDIYAGKAEADDPENLLFKEVRSVEDMIYDKMNSTKEQDALRRALGKNLGLRNSIKSLIDFKKLTSPLERFFTTDDRSSTPEQYNPVHMVAEQSKITIHGTGGIQSEHAVTQQLRDVHPSHMGFIDPVHTPESEKTGTALHLAASTVKDGRQLRTYVKNVKTGQLQLLTPTELYEATVAFPDEQKDGKWKDPKNVRAQKMGKVIQVPASSVNYIMPDATTMFSHSSNLVPFLKNNQGNRVMMAAKMLGQAIPLVNRQAPLVQTQAISGKTFHQEFGENFSVKSPIDGKITEVKDDYIKVGDQKISLYNNFPLNQKTSLHHTPLVKVGDMVKKGQLLADSNYTDKGVLAIGTNLNVAYLPYPGLTFEDGIVITESGAKKLAAEQTYRTTFERKAGQKELNFKRFLGFFPGVFDKASLDSYDDDGVIKKGSAVKKGQILIAGLSYNANSPENMTLKRINKSLMKPWSNAAETYSGEFDGVVTDVVKRADKVEVFVKSVEPATASDKLSGVHGNKGVITKVIPDNEAPRTADGRVPDVFLNPHGIIGRINLGQMFEAAAGKIAQKTGQPYIVKNFNDDNTAKVISEELKKHNLSDTEELFDASGKPLGKVSVGTPYFLRLAKTGKTGFSARTPGSGYDMNMQPLRGGEEGTKSMDLLTIYAMLSHGAKKNLYDAHLKSEKNDELWHAVETGRPIPAPKPTFAFEKFLSLLKGAGINTSKQNGVFALNPLTDKDTASISKGKIDEWNFFYGKNMKEIKGGLFDVSKTGGLSGKNYAHIELPEKMPNPVFEKAIKAILEIDEKKFDGVMAGKLYVKDGVISETKQPGSLTGGEAISKLLDGIDVQSALTAARRSLGQVKEGDNASLDRITRKIRYLQNLKELGLKASEAYTRKLVPVIPPIFRPVQEIAGANQVSPSNYLYQGLGLLVDTYKAPVMKFLDDKTKGEFNTAIYEATKVLAGTEDAPQKGRSQKIQGFIKQIEGDSPKKGFFLNKLVNKKQDLVGRGVIVNGPDLHVDEIGIPEKMAWQTFKPFIVREFTKSGYKPDFAREQIEKKTDLAKRMMQTAMNQRTVMMNRAPSLHKFSIMAFKPKLVQGLDIQVPSLVFKGFNADIDGDTVNIHVPVTQEALNESYNMLPSKNLWKPGSGELMIMPSQESAIGIYFLSQTPEGRKRLNEILPAGYHIDKIMDGKAAKEFYNKLAKEVPHQFPTIVSKLKQMGDKQAFNIGFTASINDITVDTRKRDAVFKVADAKVDKIRASMPPGPKRDDAIASIYEAAAKEAYGYMKEQLKDKNSNFYHMIASGARGKDSQLMQMVSAPGIVMDGKDNRIPVPIKKSYAEGVTTADYFMSSYGVRKGIIDRALQTSKPGALNKDVMASVVDNIITIEECGTDKGVMLPVDSINCQGRYLAKDTGGFKRNTLVTPQVSSALVKSGLKQVEIRSPLKCLATKGTCAHCFGLDEHGNKVHLGENVGVKMGQAMTEPVTQMTMRTFHSGGVSTGGPKVGGFQRVSQLLNMPKYVAGEATLSTMDGRVTKIQKTDVGTSKVFVEERAHTVRPGLNLLVKVGDRVKKGDRLSEGVLKPQDIARLKDFHQAQEYVVDELDKTFRDQEVKLDRKVFETVVRSLTNNTRVIDAPTGSGFLPGDIIPYTVARRFNETRKKNVPVEDAVGMTLTKPEWKFQEGRTLTEKDVKDLLAVGIKKVEAAEQALKHAPQIKGITQVPELRSNWMTQLGYRQIKKTLTEGAAQGWKSDTEGEHPIPALAYGVNFGKKKVGY